MRQRKKLKIILALLLTAAFVHIISNQESFIEKYYSLTFFPSLAQILRYLFGWLPFSIGDFFYGAICVWLIYFLVKFVYNLFKKRITKDLLRKYLWNFTVFVPSVYIVFQLLWGFNYDRAGIAFQLRIENEKYSLDELKNLDSLLLIKVNESKKKLMNTRVDTSSSSIFKKSVTAYAEIKKKYSFFHYQPSSIKPSLWGWLGDYAGFLGYYNPFTGEAQVNTTVPYYVQPYTACHEISHQIGYGKEDEANFIGFLAATNSSDALLQYSAYLDVFLMASRNLAAADSVSARRIARQLLPEAKSDIIRYRMFLWKHESEIEPVIRWIYGIYLQSNKQPDGIVTYDKAIGLLISYHKKYSEL